MRTKPYWERVGMMATLALMIGCGATPKTEAPQPPPAKAAEEKAPAAPAAPAAKTEAAQPKKEAAQPKAEQEQAKPEQPKKSDPIGDVINGTGKVIEGAGKVIIDGGGKVLDGAGKVIIDGGGKVVVGAGEVIGGAGVAIGKAVGDVIETAFAPGTKAPDFKLRDLEGHPVALSDFKGSPVVLLFCTTSYPPCVVEMRHLRDLQAKYESDHLKVIAIALDWEGPAALRRFQQEMALNYPLLWDNGEVFKAYTQIPNVPTTFFIDKNGHILKKRVGFSSATIITEGSSMVGTSMVELDKAFEKDLLELLKK